MRTFEQYNSDEQNLMNLLQKQLIDILHIHDLDIKFDFINYTGHLLYFYKDEIVISHYKKNDFLFINKLLYDKMSSIDKNQLKDVLKKYLNINYIVLTINPEYSCSNVNNNFNI